MDRATAPAEPVVLDRYDDVREALRQRDLKQALYDAGGDVMAGSLITLHGEEHKRRRRAENRLFRRGTFRWWELHLVPGTIESSYAAALERGRTDLVHLGRRTIMYLTALVAGIDPPADEAAADRLERLAHVFSAGATAVHSTRDPEELRRDVERAMAEFDEEFLAPARRRREDMLAGLADGTVDEQDLPRDVLTAVLRNRDELGMTDAEVRREVAFYLQAGSHSTANLFTHSMHRIFSEWADPAFAARLTDRRFVQRCVLETLRLNPASPVAWRRVMADVTLRNGRALPSGSLVELDLRAANTDPAVFGPDAAAFDPDRVLPDGVAPWGHSFGGGMHACIGMELDGGVVAGSSADGEENVYGTVTLMVAALLEAGVRPDPDEPPTEDRSSSRPNFERYPVVFDPAARVAHEEVPV
ncbi:cytochrome P450 [Pseudonocardia parietis]|uniref:Cytochrome P450 n=1 Tax=Pseudonocardia parietis TaxID=570936 RepID=A0ABS4VRK4_9PSEU|nr:cytochrome P450 [Pseudonocardia parietis]MBP2366557.1 cytochrome P450 [Pseudonocardia parietis]